MKMILVDRKLMLEYFFSALCHPKWWINQPIGLLALLVKTVQERLFACGAILVILYLLLPLCVIVLKLPYSCETYPWRFAWLPFIV
jgi:hypothetical protein